MENNINNENLEILDAHIHHYCDEGISFKDWRFTQAGWDRIQRLNARIAASPKRAPELLGKFIGSALDSRARWAEPPRD